MNHAERQRVVQHLNTLEQRYPVDRWQVEGIHLWPVWKMKFFAEAFKAQNPLSGADRSPGSGRLLRWQAYLRAHIWRFRRRLPPADQLFVAEPVFRVEWQGESRNRFFDVMMDRGAARMLRVLLLETKPLRERRVYQRHRVADISDLLPAFLRPISVERDWVRLKATAGFADFLHDVQILFGWNEERLLRATKTSVRLVGAWYRLFRWALRQVKPREVFQLCYYNAPQYGLNLACREAGIRVSELQHGSQGHSHPAYHYTVQPAGGYSVLPDTFLCWDEPSVTDVLAWCEPGHHAQLFGNPWVDLLMQHEMPDNDAVMGKPLVVFTLQPLAEPVPPFLLDAVGVTAAQVQWWFRFHPRMSASEVAQVATLLAGRALDTVVHLELPQQSGPLPLLLRKASLHVSRYSGAVSEAALVGTRSLIVDPLGAATYSQLVAAGKATVAETTLSIVENIKCFVLDRDAQTVDSTITEIQ